MRQTISAPPFFQWRRAIFASGLAPTTRHVLLTLGSHVSDREPTCYPSIDLLAAETGLTRRAVITHLKLARETGWIAVSKQSRGRRWARNHYRIAWPAGSEAAALPDALTSETSAPSDGLDSEAAAPFDAPQGATHAPPASHVVHEHHPSKPSNSYNEVNPDAPATLTAGTGAEAADPDLDLQLAHWLFGLIRAMHPGHRPPRFGVWARDIRLMRERDGRTRREIAGLFRWANADPFWRANILSPAKLRAQWDTLAIRRQQARAAQAGQGGAAQPGRPEDRRCAHRDAAATASEARCAAAGSLKLGRGESAAWYCAAHYWQHADECEPVQATINPERRAPCQADVS